LDATEPFPESDPMLHAKIYEPSKVHDEKKAPKKEIMFQETPRNAPYSLCAVDPDSEEARKITALLQLKHITKKHAVSDLRSILRVQNNELHSQFRNFIEAHPPIDHLKEIRLLYHGSKRTDAWDYILSQGIKPELCIGSWFGIGTYFVSNIEPCIQVSGFFTEDDDSSKSYTAVGLFMCYVGDTKENLISQHECIPEGYGSFGDIDTKDPANHDKIPQVFAIQDTRRAYPAYILIFEIE